MKAKALVATLLAAAVTFVLAGCASATTSCTVQHQYAIVVFQNGMGNNSSRVVTRFQLNVKYGPYNTMHWLINSRIVLNVAKGSNPPMVVRTYRVGHALSCRVDGVRAHQ